MGISKTERLREGPISFDHDLHVGEFAGETVAVTRTAAGYMRSDARRVPNLEQNLERQELPIGETLPFMMGVLARL